MRTLCMRRHTCNILEREISFENKKKIRLVQIRGLSRGMQAGLGWSRFLSPTSCRRLMERTGACNLYKKKKKKRPENANNIRVYV